MAVRRAKRPKLAVQDRLVSASVKSSRAKKEARHAVQGIDSELSALAEKVKSKEHSLSLARGHAHRRQVAQRDADSKISRLTSERDSLVNTLDLISGQRKVADDERQAAARDLKAAEADWTAVRNRLRKHASYAAIRDAVDSVDAEIDRLRKKAAGLEKKMSVADGRAATARAALAAVEKERRDAQDALQRLPNEIRAARGQVTRLLGDVSAATPDEAARVGAAQPALRVALDGLRAHVRGAGDDGLARSLVDTTAFKKATARNEREMARLAKARETLTRTQGELQTRIEQRENDIRSRVLKDKAKPA